VSTDGPRPISFSFVRREAMADGGRGGMRGCDHAVARRAVNDENRKAAVVVCASSNVVARTPVE